MQSDLAFVSPSQLSLTDMNKFIIALASMALLTACGGGGGGSTIGGQPVSSIAPALPVSTVPSAPSDQIVAAPVPPSGSVTIRGGGFNQGASGQDSVFNFIGAVNLTLSGQLDRIWVSATLAGGSVVVSGDQNTLVFMPGVDTIVTVTGTGNTFYLPVGSPINIEGSGVAFSTVRHYQP